MRANLSAAPGPFTLSLRIQVSGESRRSLDSLLFGHALRYEQRDEVPFKLAPRKRISISYR